MKIRLEMEVDLHSGNYDVRFHNLTQPGEDIDVGKLAGVVHRVLEHVHAKNQEDLARTHKHVRTRVN